MKKLLCLFTAVLLSLTMLFSFACGKGSGNDKPSDDDRKDTDIVINLDKNVEADITIAVPGGNQNERDMIRCLIDDFSDMYPNVEISMNYLSVNSYVNDVMNMSAAEKAGEMDFEEDFYTEYFDMGSIDSKKYVVPRSCDSVVTFYNKDLFTKAGVDMNLVKNGWTWDTFMDVCATLRSYMDTHNMSDCYVVDANLTTWLSVCYPMLSAYGSEPIDENGKNSISNEKTMQCLQMVREMVTKKYICDSQNATTKSFENGGSAMIFQSASVSLYADRTALKDKIDLVSFPLITANGTPKIGAGIAGYSIASSSKNKDVAWAFLRHLLSYDGQQNMANNGLNLASIRKDLADYKTANWGGKYKDLNLSAYTYGSEYKTSCEFFARTDLSAKADIQTAIQSMFNGASNASKDLNKVMSTAKADIDDALVF